MNARCNYPGSESSQKTSPEADVLTRLKRIEASLSRLEARGPRPDQEGRAQLLTEPLNATQGDNLTDLGYGHSPGSGKIVVEEEQSRFVEGSFWADLEEEEDEKAKQSPAHPELEDAVHTTSPAQQTPYSHDPALSLCFNGTRGGLRNLHPPPERIFTLWQLFIENVDPLLKIIHVPSTQRKILQASNSLNEISPAFESLMFAIYYSAVSSLGCARTCRNLLHEERAELLDRYRFGVEQGLASANFMSSPKLFSIQALTLFLICARHHTERTLVWSLTGLAIRLATKLGLHRDPDSLGLSPFVSEMRRRLWWQIVILDVLTAEENDIDASIHEHTFDTKFPANVNDQELDLNMTAPVTSDMRRTEMLFAFQRFEISYGARKVLFSDKFAHDNGYEKMSLAAKNEYLDKLYRDLDAKYFSNYDSNIPICFMTQTASRLVLAKMKLTIYHPARNSSSAMLKSSLPDLIKSSIDIVEHIQILRGHESYKRWVWLFQRYVEWDAVAFLLRSLSVCPQAELASKAWKLIDSFFETWSGRVPSGSIIRRWQRLEALKARAEANRDSGNGRATSEGVEVVQMAQESQARILSVRPHEESSDFGGDDSSNQVAVETTQPNEAEHWAPSQSLFTQSDEPVLMRGPDMSSFPDNHLTSYEYSHPANVSTWRLDGIAYPADDGPSWVMDIDDHQFDSWF